MIPLYPATLADITSLIQRGGWVMYPLLLLSLTALTLITERTIFWLRLHTAARRRTLNLIAQRARRNELPAAEELATRDGSPYGSFAAALIKTRRETPNTDLEAAAQQHLEDVRIPLERFGVVLATIITAAPMLGILGTVTGIIRSFNLLDADQIAVDPAAVAGGIAEALFTTAFGLLIALVTLFPHAIFRAQTDRALNRLDALAAAITSRSS
ncbi:MAG: MotA/TolQ/ExbB proton channel family protein [Planctomycetota bacterium]